MLEIVCQQQDRSVVYNRPIMAKRILTDPSTSSTLKVIKTEIVTRETPSPAHGRTAKETHQQHYRHIIPSTLAPSDSDLQIDEPYDEYLSGVLSDFGLQLSPGGNHVQELTEQTQSDLSNEFEYGEVGKGGGGGGGRGGVGISSPTSADESLDDDIAPTVTATTCPGSKFRKINELQKIKNTNSAHEEKEQDKKPPPTRVPSVSPKLEPLPVKTPFLPSPEDPLLVDIPSEDSSKKRPKKYEWQPLTDQEEERKRLNAVNARRNRIKQKKHTQELTEKNRSLQNINSQCSKALRKTTSDVQKLEKDIEDRQRQRNALEEELRRREQEVSQQREQLKLFQGHLDLISSSLDDENPAKKLILTLLQKVTP